MHASYVTLSAKHRNLCFRLSAIVAEDLPCFDLGSQSLNVEKDEKINCQLDKISTEKKNAKLVLCERTRQISAFGRRRGESHKSSTTWAVRYERT